MFDKGHKLLCQSCALKCEILPQRMVKSANCLNGQVSIWPNSNMFFTDGLLDMLKSTRAIIIGKGYLFVDFSYYNIKYFLNTDWNARLVSSGLTVILVTDRYLKALALYFQSINPGIKEVLSSTDGVIVFRRRLEYFLSGRSISTRSYGKINYTELQVLKYLIKGMSVQEIASRTYTTDKRIYNLRSSIERKMGITIKRML